MSAKKIIAVIMLFITAFSGIDVYAANVPVLDGRAYILMEASTGKVLAENNADEALPPASVTKIMTLLLIYENIESGRIHWDDNVSVSMHAAGMGGSQIFLEPNEIQSVETLTKAIAVASANDAAVAMAEHIAGSEEAFVDMMNKRASELGMTNTTFKNACGLDTDGHKMSARDIAVMSRELITKYPEITKFTTVWQDTITHKTAKGEKEFGLTNTNRLIKWYDGATGLKTGSTGNAFYCLSGTAKRNGMELIAVIMACPDPKQRFREVMKMLDYGYANYELKKGEPAGKIAASAPVLGGSEDYVNAVVENQVTYLCERGKAALKSEIKLDESIKAPVKKGDKIGEIIYTCGDETAGSSPLIAEKDIERGGFGKNAKDLFKLWLQG
ncbi:MAG: D-alanyl-D-alanine carboxypeptidase [Firmicutes bacterium]|nr:D-alanyl-D-alanine carboxypeptidase [Bacillota bacterium]